VELVGLQRDIFSDRRHAAKIVSYMNDANPLMTLIRQTEVHFHNPKDGSAHVKSRSMFGDLFTISHIYIQNSSVWPAQGRLETSICIQLHKALCFYSRDKLTHAKILSGQCGGAFGMIVSQLEPQW
jgi:hypothetical protein